jgi:arylsulfatase A-like enzyme
MSDTRRPDIVVIYADDLGYGDLGCYGSTDIATPNLDRLAAGGVRCTDWYSNAPVCSPSRAALLTGRHPANTGVTEILAGTRTTPGLDASIPTLASHLRTQGYRTGVFGKWHLGGRPEDRPLRHGFDEFVGILAGCVDYYSHISYWGSGVDPYHDLWDGDREIWRNGDYLTDLITSAAVEFIQQSSQSSVDQPFLCYVPYNAPHYPMHAPAEWMDRFSHLRPERQAMAAMIGAMDAGVGRILDALEDGGRADDTIVVFSSDNGPSAETRNWLDGTVTPYRGGTAGPFRGHKGSLFDGGIREPFLLRCPGALPAGVTAGAMGQMSDVLPTLMSLAGLAVPEGMDGVDATAALTCGAAAHDRLYWAFGDQLAVREGDLKLVLNGSEDMSAESFEPVHLSDLRLDPGESTDLAGSRPADVARLTELARTWRSSLLS